MSKEHREPRVLVTYQSQTGNTRKVAEAIFNAIPERPARASFFGGSGSLRTLLPSIEKENDMYESNGNKQ